MPRRSDPLRQLAALAAGAVALLAAATARADIRIVFASRSLGANPDDAARQQAIERSTSGRLLVRESSDRVSALVDAGVDGAAPEAPVDVIDPDVSWDGNRIVFAGYSQQESAWRIYEVGADCKGLRQLTRSDRRIDLGAFGEGGEAALGSYDDVDPCYLPDDRICFVSTRYPTVAPDGRLRGTNLYVIDADGSDLHRITTERFGADTPAVYLFLGGPQPAAPFPGCGAGVATGLSCDGREPCTSG